MRGKAIAQFICRGAQRITPAHAGKSSVPSAANFSLKDHPRTCGEKLSLLSIVTDSLGSPPHMRGKGRNAFILCFSRRITPAHAGKSLPINATPEHLQDHPRTCGEKWQIDDGKVSANGSPPHMRGKAVQFRNHIFILRITPAHAGKRGVCLTSCDLDEDHPRTCGEKNFPWYIVVCF